MQDVTFLFNPEKDEKLKRERGIGFKEIITLIETGYLLFNSNHPNQEKYPGQCIYEIEVNNYVYLVPYIKNGNEVFLKTIYADRKATKKYGKGIKDGKKT